MNIPPEVQAVSDCYLGGPLYAVMQEVITLVETPPLPVMRITPSQVRKRVDQVFELDLIVDTGPGVVNAFVVHMAFDPTVLQVVGPGGAPAKWIIPAGPDAMVLVNAVKTALLKTEGVEEAKVELVWDPPWSIAQISPEARLDLGLDF